MHCRRPSTYSGSSTLTPYTIRTDVQFMALKCCEQLSDLDMHVSWVSSSHANYHVFGFDSYLRLFLLSAFTLPTYQYWAILHIERASSVKLGHRALDSS
ncbi:hypothetical protein VNO77_20149 [Canavalia gladiata]|uniref:Uncharacterized protein n=1 Tax=Canavalia gladiata TaxID=3824 RepID=A0AAN9LSP1_CANGL